MYKFIKLSASLKIIFFRSGFILSNDLGKIDNLGFDAKKSQLFASELLKKGIYVVGFFYPVVPKGAARIRVQLSASHTHNDIDFALEAFKKVGEDLGVI